jgi:RNA polymerase sigma factor (TIGR02999 family)
MEGHTELIRRWAAGDNSALGLLFEAFYAELQRLARARLWRDGGTLLLNATALVHETFLRFADAGPLKGDDCHAFLGYASVVMRSVIVDAARQALAVRNGGGVCVVSDEDLGDEGCNSNGESGLVNEALQDLARAEPRLAQVVEMRCFGGYSVAEVAGALGVTERTVGRDWLKARLLLRAAMQP